MCQPMPVGLPKSIKLTRDEFLEENIFGFVEATVRSPSSLTKEGYVGLLPIKFQGRLICPVGQFTGWFFSEELRFALDNGYQLISIKQAYQFQRGDNAFYDIIQQLNKMKIKAQENNQPTIRNISKLLMNSMYGRFGMHTENIHHKIVNTKQLTDIANHFSILGEIPLGNFVLVTYTLKESTTQLGSQQSQNLISLLEGSPSNTNVAIAAAVTSYSRMIINQYKLDALALGLEIYYSDTDSLVLNGALPENYCNSAALGKFKLEHKFTEGIFIMPKVYYLLTEEGKEINKCKGFSGKLNRSQYLDLLEGKTLDLRVTKWIRSLKNHSIQIHRDTPYQIKPTLNKRNKIYDSLGKWVNTTPIILP
jgi:hypothetical protein